MEGGGGGGKGRWAIGWAEGAPVDDAGVALTLGMPGKVAPVPPLPLLCVGGGGSEGVSGVSGLSMTDEWMDAGVVHRGV